MDYHTTWAYLYPPASSKDLGEPARNIVCAIQIHQHVLASLPPSLQANRTIVLHEPAKNIIDDDDEDQAVRRSLHDNNHGPLCSELAMH